MDTSKARLLIFQLPFKGNTRRFHQRIFSSNNFSSTSFVFNETRIVLINWYGAIIIKFDTTYTIYISVCVYIGRGNCPSSGLLLSGVVVVRGGSCPGGDVRSPTKIQRLQLIQNSLARAVTRTPRHHITPVLKSLHWLKIPERIHFKVLSLTYNSLQSSKPT